MKAITVSAPKSRQATFAQRIKPNKPPAKLTGRRRGTQTKSILEIKFRRILVPIDFSRAAITSLSYAAAIARLHGARIVLLHVTKPITVCVDCGYGPFDREGPDDAQAKIDRSHLKKAASKLLPSAVIENVEIRHGIASEQILRAAKETEADLIVLYAHEANEAKTVGSHETAERVIRSAPCPVLVARPHQHEFVG